MRVRLRQAARCCATSLLRLPRRAHQPSLHDEQRRMSARASTFPSAVITQQPSRLSADRAQRSHQLPTLPRHCRGCQLTVSAPAVSHPLCCSSAPPPPRSSQHSAQRAAPPCSEMASSASPAPSTSSAASALSAPPLPSAPASALHIALSAAEQSLFRLLLAAVPSIPVDADAEPLTVRVAGGWVRDRLLGLQSDDLDLCLNSVSGEAFAQGVAAFCSSQQQLATVSSIAVIPSNPSQSKHLETARFLLKLQQPQGDGGSDAAVSFELDANRFREEVYEPHSRIPLITPSTAAEDALRRDFTVNALFYNLHSGEVEDHVNGLQDLRDGRLRTPRPPLKTFRDDPLRALRAARFAARFGFSVDAEIAAAAASAQLRSDLRLKISRERVGAEVKKMMSRLQSATRALSCLSDWRLRQAVLDVDVPDKRREEKDRQRQQRERGGRQRAVGAADDGKEAERALSADANATRVAAGFRLWKVEERLEPEDAELTAACVRCMRMMHSRLFTSAWDDCSAAAVHGNPVLEPPLTAEQASQLLLLSYLTPYFGWTHVRSKTPLPAYLVRESLKLPVEQLRLCQDLLNAAAVLTDLSRQHAALPSSPASGSDDGQQQQQQRRLEVAAGKQLRRLSSHYHLAVLLAPVFESAFYCGAAASSASHPSLTFPAFLSHLQHSTGLFRCCVWRLRPLLDGNAVKAALGIAEGMQVKEALERLEDWQIANIDRLQTAGEERAKAEAAVFLAQSAHAGQQQ